jgi:hypothetical protein
MTLLVAVISPLNAISVSNINYVENNESASATASLKEAQRGFVINGESSGDFSGISVSNAGDVNGDGLDDLLITKPFVLVPAAMADKLIASVLFCLPNTIYDLPAFEMSTAMA